MSELVNTFRGVVFAKEDGMAFINLPRVQVWLPSKGLRVGDEVEVTIKKTEASR